jgi:peroxin-14
MSSSDRDELIRNAVAFLSDPGSQSSPVPQRIKFLEAKGLTPTEIDIAFRQATPQQNASYPAYPSPYYAPRQWDWRDYFVRLFLSMSRFSINRVFETPDNSNMLGGSRIRCSFCI